MKTPREGTPILSEDKPWEYMVHCMYVDGSQSYDIFDTKEDTNQFLTGILQDPDVGSYTAYQLIRHGVK